MVIYVGRKDKVGTERGDLTLGGSQRPLDKEFRRFGTRIVVRWWYIYSPFLRVYSTDSSDYLQFGQIEHNIIILFLCLKPLI